MGHRGEDREEQNGLSLMRKAQSFWVSMHFIELYSDRLSFIFLDSDLLHCLIWLFSFCSFVFSFLASFTSSITALVVFPPSPLHYSLFLLLQSPYLLRLVPPFSVKLFRRFSLSKAPLSILLARVLR